jgi:transcriptional regulator with XRE-family HTH domain
VEEARPPNQLLRRARLLRGWSQQRVADHINAPNRQLVYRWETGKRSPGPFYRERLCQEFKMTAEELGLVRADDSRPGGRGAYSGRRPGRRDHPRSRGQPAGRVGDRAGAGAVER